METLAVLISTDRIGRVIGKSGANLTQIRDACRAQITVAQSDGELRRVEINGGPQEAVLAFHQVLQKAFYSESSYSVTCLLPESKVGSVVGRGGENLKKIRESSGVRITLEKEPVPSSKQERQLTLLGQELEIAQAMSMILGAPDTSKFAWAGHTQVLSINSYLAAPHLSGGGQRVSQVVQFPTGDAEELQVHMLVPDSMAGAVLGKGGSQVKHIASEAGCKVSLSDRDGISDRKVVMVGTASQVAAAQQIVWNQLVEAKHKSSEAMVNLMVRREAAGVVIGKQGSTLKGVREQSGAKIVLGKDEVSGHRPCMISGDISKVLEAEMLIADLVKTVPVEMASGTTTALGPKALPGSLNFMAMPQVYQAGVGSVINASSLQLKGESTKLLVPSTAAGAVIGSQGSRLRQLRDLGVQVQMLFPDGAPQWPEDRVMILKGPLIARQSAVETVLRETFQASKEPEKSTMTLKVLVPVEKIGALIGKQGASLRAIREQSGISIQVARDDVEGERLVSADGSLRQVCVAAFAILATLPG